MSRELFALIDARLEPFDDAMTAVADCASGACRSRSPPRRVRERLDRTLARAGLQFDVTIAGDEVEHGKPAPDMFLLAAQRLGVEPAAASWSRTRRRASPPGRAAGMPTLGVRRVPAETISREPTRVVEP